MHPRDAVEVHRRVSKFSGYIDSQAVPLREVARSADHLHIVRTVAANSGDGHNMVRLRLC